ncbi:MAG: hypothetical protein V2I56_11375 [Desulfobacteraceae bacterium]|jgi:hypothetical protein|nr:hypothetical protein [Desulfobacteraceae bacterium]
MTSRNALFNQKYDGPVLFERSSAAIMEITELTTTKTPSYLIIDHTMKMQAREKPKNCPWCGSNKIALLLRGMPVFLPELEYALDGGGIAIGNLPSDSDEPAWQCTECYAQFFREPF